jgi:hypothetical protein
VAVAALCQLVAAAAGLGPAELAQMCRLDTVGGTAGLIDVEGGVVPADEDDVRGDVRPRATGDLLVHPASPPVTFDDQAAVPGAV